MATTMKDFNCFLCIITILFLGTVSSQTPAISIKQCEELQKDAAGALGPCSVEVPANQPYLQLDCSVTGIAESVAVNWLRGVEEVEVVPGDRMAVGPHGDETYEVTLTITEEVVTMTTSEVYTCAINGTNIGGSTEISSSISITIIKIDVEDDDRIAGHGFYLALLVLAFIILIVVSVCVGYRCKMSGEGSYPIKYRREKDSDESAKSMMEFYA